MPSLSSLKNSQLTYRELNERANQLAWYSEKGHRTNGIRGLVYRSRTGNGDCLLGILKAGGLTFRSIPAAGTSG